jgi:hypothetical protein
VKREILMCARARVCVCVCRCACAPLLPLPDVRSFTPSLLRSFTPSVLHSFAPSLHHSFTPSLLHSFTPSLLHSFTPSLLHSFTPSLLHSFTPSVLHSFTPSLLHSFTTVSCGSRMVQDYIDPRRPVPVLLQPRRSCVLSTLLIQPCVPSLLWPRIFAPECRHPISTLYSTLLCFLTCSH